MIKRPTSSRPSFLPPSSHQDSPTCGVFILLCCVFDFILGIVLLCVVFCSTYFLVVSLFPADPDRRYLAPARECRRLQCATRGPQSAGPPGLAHQQANMWHLRDACAVRND